MPFMYTIPNTSPSKQKKHNLTESIYIFKWEIGTIVNTRGIAFSSFSCKLKRTHRRQYLLRKYILVIHLYNLMSQLRIAHHMHDFISFYNFFPCLSPTLIRLE